jgi:hypothetical protein
MIYHYDWILKLYNSSKIGINSNNIVCCCCLDEA